MRLLLVEDDRELSSALAKGLREEGFAVDQAFDGEDGLFEAMSSDHDLLILDIMLPVHDGYTILESTRRKGSLTPAIFLTARGDIEDRVRGLRLGADDYLVKPFSFEELLARIKAVLRRSAQCARNLLHRGKLELDLDRRRASWDKIEVSLTPREFAILEALLMVGDKVLSRTAIIRHIYDDSYDYDSNLIDVHIGHLRRKFRDATGNPIIETVRGEGFRIAEEAP